MTPIAKSDHPIRQVDSLDQFVLHVLANPRPVVAVTCAKACEAGQQMAGLLAELSLIYQGQVDFVLIPPAALPELKAAAAEQLAHSIVLFSSGQPVLRMGCEGSLPCTSKAIRQTILRDYLGIGEPKP